MGAERAKRLQVIQTANQLDRRRQAQIASQVGAINRLLKDGTYGAEMETLHKAAATLAVENHDLAEALRQLADACAHDLPGSAWTDAIDAAIQRATELIGPMQSESAVSAPVSESDGATG